MVKGLRSLERKLTVTIPRKVEAELRKTMARQANKIVAMMQSLAPFKDGDLEASIGWVWGTTIPDGAIPFGGVGGSENDIVITIYAGSKEAYYALFQEFGTQDMAANPYFFPSWRYHKRGTKSAMARAIGRGLK